MLLRTGVRLTFIAICAGGIAWTAARLTSTSSQPADPASQGGSASPSANEGSLFVDQSTTTQRHGTTSRAIEDINLDPPVITGVSETLKDLTTSESWDAERASSLRASLVSLPQSDLADVTRWARQLDRQAPATYLLLNETLEAWTAAYPDTALTGFLNASGRDEEWLDFGLSIIIRKASKTNPEQAWRELSAGRYLTDRQEIEQSLLSSWAKTDPSAVADAISNEITSRDLPAKGQAAAIVANGLWSENPTKAIAWIQSLPPDAPATGQALSAVMDRWLNKSPQEAIDWLADTPASPMRDAGVSALIGSLQASDPELAVRWATELTPGPKRNRQLIDSLQSLDSINPSRTAIILKDRSLLTEEEAEIAANALWPVAKSTSEEADSRPGE